jgi:sugar lactone lactonase YvrE
VTVEIAVAAGAGLGECPIWSPRDARLYWIDIEGRSVHRYDPSTGEDEQKTLPIRPGSMVLTDRPGRFLMGAEVELGWYEWSTGEFTAVGQLEPAGTGNRLNDGRTDRQGRYWVGSMYERSTAGIYTGMLHRVDSGLGHEAVRSEIGVSNGIAFSLDGSTMYFADTPRRTVWQYDYDRVTGEQSNERVFTDFAELPGKPDGASVDEDGCYWIACVTGWAVARLTPDGTVDRVIEVPVEKPSMPSFGGADMATLFVTSIGDGTTPGTDQSLAGALLAIDVGVAGVVETPFAG